MEKVILPAEWEPQSGIMLTWPHQNTDWKDILEEVEDCFLNISREISRREKLLIVCPDKKDLISKLDSSSLANIRFAELSSNDTWARDHGPITVLSDGKPVVYDFTFNGWGMKFAANLDNQITAGLHSMGVFSSQTKYANKTSFVLEGGSIESDGQGTLMTTTQCLCSKNRNGYMSQIEIENYLKITFGLRKILWITSGYLAGDDTDSHIDTLARFCDSKTIAYIKCEDPADEHYEALKKMEEELKAFRTFDDAPYNLIPLPMADPVYEDGQRLPATYANFLIINDAILVPVYNSAKDAIVLSAFQEIFPNREIVGIGCHSLIKQHGSLHCITMQFPKGVLK